MKKNIPFILILIILMSTIIFGFIKKRSKQQINTDYPVLLVGTNAEYYPFSFLRDGIITGFDIDLITEIAKRLQKQLVIKDFSFDVLIPELQFGNIHIIAAGLTPHDERAKSILFADAHIVSDELVLCVKKDSSIKNLEDFKQKIVVVNEGYSGDVYVSQDPFFTPLRLSSPTVAEGLLALHSDKADGYIISKTVLSTALKEKADQYRLISLPHSKESYALAISKKHAVLLPLINKTLQEMRDDKTIELLEKKWGFL